ncbi:MAG TPA: hypothetical protein VF758_03945 [Candidatus Acidoferrum sp.]
MFRHKWVLPALVVLGLAAAGALAYREWHSRNDLSERGEMLSLLPPEATSVVFLDLAQFRSSPFLRQLLAWAPQQAPEDDYAQFVEATGFRYERDLDRAAVATIPAGQNSAFFGIAEGRFDRKKIEAYAGRSGKHIDAGGAAIYSLQANSTSRRTYLRVLRDDRIAWTNDPAGLSFLQYPGKAAMGGEWRDHFARLAGTPLFAVLRQDAPALAELPQQAPDGYRSPQLAGLLSQLQWVAIAGKPDGNMLRVVVDGECLSENTVRQLNDFLSGIVVLAQAGLNGPKARKQLDPQVREACLGLLNSVDVQKMDRGTSKSVRVVFDITPKLLEAARTSRDSQHSQQ